MSTGWYVGRFQPLHDGHKACIKHILDKHDRVVIALRDTEKGDKNPFSAEERRKMVEESFPEETADGRIVVVDFPDPECDLTVYIGRAVGYDLIQLDAQTEAISATNIRKKLYQEE